MRNFHWWVFRLKNVFFLTKIVPLNLWFLALTPKIFPIQQIRGLESIKLDSSVWKIPSLKQICFWLGQNLAAVFEHHCWTSNEFCLPYFPRSLDHVLPIRQSICRNENCTFSFHPRPGVHDTLLRGPIRKCIHLVVRQQLNSLKSGTHLIRPDRGWAYKWPSFSTKIGASATIINNFIPHSNL